jgi:hypothetical protein
LKGDLARLIDFHDVIHYYVGWISQTFEIGDRLLEQSSRSFAIDCRQDYQTRMNLHFADQATKVTRVLCDDNAILSDAPLQNMVVRLAPPTDVQRMDSVVAAYIVQPNSELRR